MSHFDTTANGVQSVTVFVILCINCDGTNEWGGEREVSEKVKE